MAKYYDIDNDVRINGKLTVNGDSNIPTSNLFVGGNITGNANLLISGNITGNIISGGSAQIATINSSTGNITNINSTGTISGGTIKGNGAQIIVGVTTASGGTVPISNGWGYTHENKVGSQGHIPTGGTATTFLRGDMTWVVPSNTNNYVTLLSGNGNGNIYLDRSGLTTLSLDLSHNHNGIYFTETESDARFLGISANAISATNASKFNNLDSSQFLRADTSGTLLGALTVSGSSATALLLQRNGSANINIQFQHSGGSGFLGIDNAGNFKVGSGADLNSSGYKLWNENNFTPSSKLDSSVFATHTGNTGLGSHIPVGGTASTFLRGDMTWVTPTDTNYYVSSLSSNAGGNGTLTVNRNATTALTIDLSHTHYQYVTNNTANQSVLTGFTMSGNAYIGTSSTAGSLVVRTTSGASAIQIAGDNGSQLAGTTIYMNASGNAKFNGTVTSNAISISSTGLVSNLNSEMINGIKEKYIAKNESVAELGGKGVYSGMSVAQQAVPNMTVLVNSGIAYTDDGMRVIYPNTSVSLSTSSATYDRKDVIYIQGSSAGANEGVIAVATGTPASTPLEPSISSDSVKLAVVLIPKNIGSIQNTYITDARYWKLLKTRLDGITEVSSLYPKLITSDSNVISMDKPIKNTAPNNSLTFAIGTTSLTWTHNLNLGNYVVRLSCNSFEPHIRWTNKTNNAITIELDDICESDVIVDVSIEAY